MKSGLLLLFIGIVFLGLAGSVSACNNNNECPVIGQICVNNFCTLPSCTTNADCNVLSQGVGLGIGGMTCNSGTCVAVPAPTPFGVNLSNPLCPTGSGSCT